ncbi:MAG: MerR family transcriptional regulator [Wujia sp.]
METYTIKEVAEMFQLPSSTLRYYEDMGLLTNVDRSKSGQRVYTQGHINRLKTICCFKKTGISIAKLQQFFFCEENEADHIDEILALLNEQQTHILEEIEQYQASLKHLKRKITYYTDMKSSFSNGTPLPNWADYRDL